MKRTGVVLPEFTRKIWTSALAQSVWEPRIQAIGAYLVEMERETCIKYSRVAMQYVTAEKLPELSIWAAKHDLSILLLNPELDAGTYMSSAHPYVPGRNWQIRVAITPHVFASTFMKAWRANDSIELGNCLGYPRCCIRFFDEVWVKERWLDTSWPMLGEVEEPLVHVFGPDECNILLRWAGVRAVPHLPCSFQCERTRMVSDRFHDKNSIEYQWIMEILSWPIEWSALHGIARIKTPIFEISTRTDHTNELYTIRREGRNYPMEGARGLVFPFRSGSEQEPGLWLDNGFKSPSAMYRAHEVVLTSLEEVGELVISIHDLGCGNGLLLEKLSRKLRSSIRLFGCDLDEKKWKAPSARFVKENITDYKINSSPSLGIISLNRFADIDDKEKLYRTLGQFTYLLVYSYNGLEPDMSGWTELVSKADGETWAKLYTRVSWQS